MAVLGQAGMINIHTPAHYASAFPGMALLGRMFMMAKKVKVMMISANEAMFESEEKADVREEISWTIGTEAECDTQGFYLRRFPDCLMFPGFGGIYLESTLQNYHQAYYEDYYTNIVNGTNYDEDWYSLTAADMHPYLSIGLDLNIDESAVWVMKIKEIKKVKMTTALLWDLFNVVINIVTERTILMGDLDQVEYGSWNM
jgi:hypothetical protein